MSDTKLYYSCIFIKLWVTVFGYLDIILLGMIAGFIILRLRSILGRKSGHESKVYPSFAEKEFSMPLKEAKPDKQNLEVFRG